jgi:hypothetical protein
MRNIARLGDSGIDIDDVYDGSISASQVLDQELYSVTSVNVYDALGNLLKTVPPNTDLGQIYSYVTDPTGASNNIWWMVSSGAQNYVTGYSYVYIPLLQGTLTISNLAFLQAQAKLGQQATLTAAQANVDAQKNWQYYLSEYAPWVIGGILGILLIGTVLKDSKGSKPAEAPSNG